MRWGHAIILPMTVDVRRGTSRFTTREAGRLTRHSFSFGDHYDPDNLGFGPLVCHDDHLLGSGHGFPPHPHSDLEIVTWVVSGDLVHDDSSSLVPGQVAVQSAGSGITHSEVAGASATRFVQAWLRPDEPGGTPARTVADAAIEPGRLVPVAGAGTSVPIRVAGAALGVVRLERGASVTLPEAPRLHVYVVTGALTRSSLAEPLAAGDAFRVTDHPALTLAAAAPTDLMVWSLP